MSRPIINAEECSGCGICVDNCPNGVLDLQDDLAVLVKEDACDACRTCEEDCPMGAIEVEEE